MVSEIIAQLYVYKAGKHIPLLHTFHWSVWVDAVHKKIMIHIIRECIITHNN